MSRAASNSTVDARMVTNVDGQMNRWKTGALYYAMPKVGVTRMIVLVDLTKKKKTLKHKI